MSGEFVAKAIGIGVFLDDYEGDNGVSSLIETSRFRGKGCLSVLYSPRLFIISCINFAVNKGLREFFSINELNITETT